MWHQWMKMLGMSAVLFGLGTTCLQAGEDVFADRREVWLQKAEAAKPELRERHVEPIGMVRSVSDSTAFQGWRMEPETNLDGFYGTLIKERIGQGKETILDFGEHLTGYVTFTLHANKDADGPVRLKLTFGEVPGELNISFTQYPGGLSRAWLQDEIVTLTALPATVTIPRRMAFRYVKVEVLGCSAYYDIYFTDMHCQATTSAPDTAPDLSEGTDPQIARIYEVGLATLSECMQTVYEDGPKRDRRLWIGDLYLESIANAVSFRNHELTKRCLYLLAALSDEKGMVRATVLEQPKPHPLRETYTMDYCLLYGTTLLEYLKATGDRETAADLWPVVKRQVEMARGYLDADGVYDVEKKPKYWLVFDWKDGYDRAASMQGLMTFAVEGSYELAQMLGVEDEVKDWPELIRQMKKSGRERYYDRKAGVVVSGPDRQISYLSQTWMILSGTLTPQEGAKALERVFAQSDAVYPGSPYAWHYVIEALIRCGLEDRARETLLNYWGQMVDKGADTFWEVYDPQNDLRSPYGFAPMNSYCHAWSCTPVYFINRYPAIFQK